MIKFDKIQQLLERESLDALLVMSAENRRYLSEFTGSSGALIITKESRFLMSDFRYKAQGAEQAEEFESICWKNSVSSRNWQAGTASVLLFRLIKNAARW